MEVPPDSLQREEVSKNDLGRRSPWWGGRKEGTSDLKHSWSQFLVGFIHPVWWHPPDDGRLCTRVAALGSWLIIICPTSSLHQAPLQLAAHALQPYALKQGGACGVFPQEFEFVIQNLTPERRLWWPNILAGWRGQVRVEATRDLPKFKTFPNNLIASILESKSYSVHIGYSLV